MIIQNNIFLAWYQEIYIKIIVNTLDKCNYNFNKVSEQLFVHKNTVFFRLDKIKEFLEIDPVKNACDRHF